MTDRTRIGEQAPIWLGVVSRPGTGTPDRIRRFSNRDRAAYWVERELRKVTGRRVLPHGLRRPRTRTVIVVDGYSGHAFRVTDPFAVAIWRRAPIDDELSPEDAS